MTISKDSYKPLHVQLKDKIERLILDRVYEDQIPSERELMQEFNVSRSTVRKAINSLVHEGILVKKHGKGTYVSIKPIQKWLGHLNSTTDVIKGLGMNPGAKLIEHRIISPPEKVKELTDSDTIYFIKRLRLANDTPIGLEQHYYPPHIGKELLKYDLNEVTLYDVIQNNLGIPFVEANQRITSTHIAEINRKYLDIDEKVCLLKAERIIKGEENSFIEYEEAYYRSDMYTFEINLARKFG